ncbi:MarR family winged helix-turn-helix transcriptional regulator [Oceanospirillum sp.]|uniref:MarR family winged helix-turn-helix transcriptional regulator n=1 Tax=Oceanospirillum sp. TaxID=2021254 RepID=UPI003A90DEC5
MSEKVKNETDAVDAIMAQWQREKPEFDLTAMEVLGRLKRASAMLSPKIEKVFLEYGLNQSEFDVLATLRRSGAPYCLAPTELFSTLMVTSGTMTNRMAQLEKKGLIERMPNPDDARSKLVKLSPKGFELIEQVLPHHVQNGLNLIAGLDAEALSVLNQSLKDLLTALGRSESE